MHPGNDEHLKQIGPVYLNLGSFTFRAVMFFIIWMALITALNRFSRRQDRLPEAALDAIYRRISGVGMVMYAFTLIFASVDWVMSLDPHWSSTIFGLIFLDSQGLIAMSFAIVITAQLVQRPPLQGIIRPSQFHDLGKLLLAMVMIWAYFGFSQWLIIWAGNIPEETEWFLKRTNGGWQYVALFLIVFQFAVPFAILLSREFKMHARSLMWLALWIILVRWLDLFWLIEPNFPGNRMHFHLSWLDLATPIGIGGLWLAYFFFNLKRRPLLAVYDPHVRSLMEQDQGHA
jgi:hypothetical protein